MAAITIKDLHAERTLERARMSCVKGASAGWVYGWIRPYVEASSGTGFGGVINVYQTNYFNIADQINNQVSVIDVQNSAANAVINVNAKQQSLNLK